ncbi:transposase [Chitinophaga alhagiae]|uniref:transposase n=1 Tax=Chitinophaga alhagiae TaxID=2203219 RepID=UPI000E5C234A
MRASCNRKNRKGRKQVKTPIGSVDIDRPRDRNSRFEAELIAKRHKTLGVDLDRQIIALHAREPVTATFAII